MMSTVLFLNQEKEKSSGGYRRPRHRVNTSRSSAIGAAGRRLSMIRNFYLAAGEFSSVCFRIRKILVFLDI